MAERMKKIVVGLGVLDLRDHQPSDFEMRPPRFAGVKKGQDGLLHAEVVLASELEEHLATRGDGSELRQAEEAVTVAKGQLASLEHALERDRRSLDQLVARQAAAERRASLLEGEDHELAERLAETEQGRHQLQAARAATEAAHQQASRRLEVAEEALRQAEQEHARSQARADALERALDEARGAAGAELLAGVDGVVGTLLDLVEVDSGWEEAFEAAAGASLTAVVVSGSEPARAALSKLRQPGIPITLHAPLVIGTLLQFAGVLAVTLSMRRDAPLQPPAPHLVAVLILAPLAAILFIWTLRSQSPSPVTGLVTTGAYALLRHPLYLAFLLMLLATGLLVTTIPKLAASTLLYLAGSELRLASEERELLDRYPLYAAYRQRTRYRYLPGLR